MAAMEDLAAKLGIDALEFFLKNLEFAPEALRATYTEELKIAAEMIDYKRKAHPRGDKTQGPIKRGLGICAAHLGRRGARQRLRRHDQSRRLGDRQHRHARPGRRHADLRRHRGCRIARPAARGGAGQHRSQRVSRPSGGSGGSTTIGGISSSSPACGHRGARRAVEEGRR